MVKHVERPTYRIETYVAGGWMGGIGRPPPTRRYALALLYGGNDGSLDVVMPFYAENLRDAVRQAEAFIESEGTRRRESEDRAVRAQESRRATRLARKSESTNDGHDDDGEQAERPELRSEDEGGEAP